MTIYNTNEQYKVAIVGDIHLRETNPRCRKDNYLNSLLAKIEAILKENDIFICLGDLFDKPSVGDECLHKFLSLLSKYNKPFYSIYGNHDLYKYSIEKLFKTSLGICILEERVNHLKSIQVYDYTFKEIPFTKHNPILPDHTNRTILLGHYFYESEIDPNYSITKEMLNNCSSPLLFLGHEHSPYPLEKVNNTLIVRNGSLCRNTINAYNKRYPVYTQLTISKSNIEMKLNTLKEFSPENIFINEVNVIKDIKKQLNTSFELLNETDFYETSSVESVMLNLSANNSHLDYYTSIKEKCNKS